MSDFQKKLQLILKESERLKQENRQMKELLKQHGINFEIKSLFQEKKDLNQSYSKDQIVKERITLYKNLFKGRTDTYAVRWESKNGKSGYAPACVNEWHPALCEKPKIKCSDCLNRQLLHLTDQVIYDHLTGKSTIGIYPLLPDSNCWFLAIDFDKNNWEKDALACLASCKKYNIPAYIERSRSGSGCHIWIFFEDAILASSARKLGRFLIHLTLRTKSDSKLNSFDRLFPNQSNLPPGGFGNLIALPLQSRPRENNNSVFVNDKFEAYPDQWSFLSKVQKMKGKRIKEIIHDQESPEVHKSPVTSYRSTEPTQMPTSIKVNNKNGIHIDKAGLPYSLINQILNLASFTNPKFFKLQAQRRSTHDIPRIINCSLETKETIILPRGCMEDLEKLLDNHSIKLCTESQKVQSSREIPLNFKGELRVQQEEAVSELLKHSFGTLSATTGFGKTIVAAALIAKRRVNTLIVVNNRQLLLQWKESLAAFLNIEKSSVGQIGCGKNNPTRLIDVATIQSLNYKGEIKQDVSQYSHIIIDECHHISAYQFEKVLQHAEATYVLGLTATPIRKDGLQPIMTMQCGPVRYSVSAKEQAKTRPFNHLLIPRATKFKSTNDTNKKIQNIYTELIHNESRNNLIFNDVLKALEEGLSPIILTERVEHVRLLKNKFEGFAKNIIVLTGGTNKKAEQKALDRLRDTPESEEQLVIATGKYIGEGFDHARLNALFLTMPISWKGTLQQYVGRLHRLHDQKTKVEVYDYVDVKEPMLKKMYDKRSSGYKAMGYVLKSEDKDENNNEQLKLF